MPAPPAPPHCPACSPHCPAHIQKLLLDRVLLRYGGPQALEAAAAAASEAAAAADGEADAANAAGPGGGGGSAAAAGAAPGGCAAGDNEEMEGGAWSQPPLLELAPDKHVDVLLAGIGILTGRAASP